MAGSPAPPPNPETPSHEEIAAALRKIDSFVDGNEEDIIRLSELLAKHPMRREAPGVTQTPS